MQPQSYQAIDYQFLIWSNLVYQNMQPQSYQAIDYQFLLWRNLVHQYIQPCFEAIKCIRIYNHHV